MPSYNRPASPIFSIPLRASMPTSPPTSPTFSYTTFITPTGLVSSKRDTHPAMSSPLPSRVNPTNTQLWTLYHFETHATTCSSCHHPYHVHRAGNKLCRTGRHLAESCAEILGAGTQQRLALPLEYIQVKSLVRAMDRSVRHPRQDPIVRNNVEKRDVLAARTTDVTVVSPSKKNAKDANTAKAVSPRRHEKSPSPSLKQKSTSPNPRRHRSAEPSSADRETSSRRSTSSPSSTPEPQRRPHPKPLKSILKQPALSQASRPSPLHDPSKPPPPPPAPMVFFSNDHHDGGEEFPFIIVPTATQPSPPHKRQHSPNPALAAQIMDPYPSFSVEIREPRKKVRHAGVGS